MLYLYPTSRTDYLSRLQQRGYALDKIPFEERRVIDELVQFWQTGYEPHDLVIHIDRICGSWGSGIGTSFFRQVYKELRTGERSKYAAFSAIEFKQFLEAEYSQQARIYAKRLAQAQAEAEAERQAQAKAEAERRVAEAKRRAEEAKRQARAREEYERKARAEFDDLGKEMAKATTRAELVELGRKRADLAPHTGASYVYENYCWNCAAHISSAIHAQCPVCEFYICGSCGSCLCGFLNH